MSKGYKIFYFYVIKYIKQNLAVVKARFLFINNLCNVVEITLIFNISIKFIHCVRGWFGDIFKSKL